MSLALVNMMRHLQSLFTHINPDLLKKAPINNMSSEGAVGGFNYELGNRGRNEVDAASSCFMKSKSYDLVELKPAGEFNKHRKQVGAVNRLVVEWKKKQAELQEAGLDKKEAASLSTEKRKMGDLQKLKLCGGPFTTPEEVDAVVDDEALSQTEKVDRLYTEVRYARDTTLSLPKNSPIFRLKEKIQEAVNRYIQEESKGLPQQSIMFCYYLDGF